MYCTTKSLRKEQKNNYIYACRPRLFFTPLCMFKERKKKQSLSYVFMLRRNTKTLGHEGCHIKEKLILNVNG